MISTYQQKWVKDLKRLRVSCLVKNDYYVSASAATLLICREGLEGWSGVRCWATKGSAKPHPLRDQK